MRIRNAVSTDVPRIEELERLCFSTPWSREVIESQMGDATHIMMAAVDTDGMLMGYAGFMYVCGEGYISNVCTAPEFRRCGVGEALLRALIARAELLSLAFLTLEARWSNEPAIALYEKLGFRRVGIRRGYYENPREDAVIMTLLFREVP